MISFIKTEIDSARSRFQNIPLFLKFWILGVKNYAYGRDSTIWQALTLPYSISVYRNRVFYLVPLCRSRASPYVHFYRSRACPSKHLYRNKVCHQVGLYINQARPSGRLQLRLGLYNWAYTSLSRVHTIWYLPAEPMRYLSFTVVVVSDPKIW